MKKFIFHLICFSILFTSCITIDTPSKANITIKNNSSCNLKIDIRYQDYRYEKLNRDGIYVRKGETFSFYMLGGLNSLPPLPHDEISNIIFSDMDTGDIIREIDEDYFYLFIKLIPKRYLYRSDLYREDFLFLITDALLSFYWKDENDFPKRGFQ
jgi:hypothetical protein